MTDSSSLISAIKTAIQITCRISFYKIRNQISTLHKLFRCQFIFFYVNLFSFIGTAIQFLKPGPEGKSPYDKFIESLSKSLNTAEANIDVFSVLDSTTASGYVDVRFTAHGSPYYNATKLIGAVLDNDNVSPFVTYI